MNADEREFLAWFQSHFGEQDDKPPAPPERGAEYPIIGDSEQAKREAASRKLTPSDLETVQVPRVLYEILIDQSRKNAATLRLILLVSIARGASARIDCWKVYKALTGLTESGAMRELREWADGQ